MPDTAPIDRAIRFIEGNLESAITVADMAAEASYSLYHFCRAFNHATHHTPYDYLMRRRLSQAANKLLRTDRKIIDIALDYQFNSPETFSRAFKRLFGTQPSRLRSQGRIDPRCLMPRLTPAHLDNLRRNDGLRPTLIELPSLQITGLMTHLRCGHNGIFDLWGLFARELTARHLVSPAPDYYGITFYPDNWETQGRLYMAGVNAHLPDTACTALVTKAFPTLACARFLHRGALRHLPLTYDYVHSTWLPKSDHVLSHNCILEDHGAALPGDDGQAPGTILNVPITPQSA